MCMCAGLNVRGGVQNSLSEVSGMMAGGGIVKIKNGVYSVASTRRYEPYVKLASMQSTCT